MTRGGVSGLRYFVGEMLREASDHKMDDREFAITSTHSTYHLQLHDFLTCIENGHDPCFVAPY